MLPTEFPRVVRLISYIGAPERYAVMLGNRRLHTADKWTMCEQWMEENHVVPAQARREDAPSFDGHAV